MIITLKILFTWG